MARKRSTRLRGTGPDIVLPTVQTPYYADALARKNDHIAEARRDVNCFIEYCFEHYDKKTKISSPYVQGWMHRQWQALMSVHSRLIIIAPRSHGKCLVAGTRIQAADGSLVPIERWVGGELPALNTETWSFERAWAPPAISNGRKEVWTLKTGTGREITATANHPFLKLDGWTNLEDLKAGDRIAIPHGFDAGGGKMPSGDAWLLGYLAGDGSTTQRVMFSNIDLELLAHVRQLVTDRGWKLTKVPGDNADYRITHKQWAKSGGPTHWLRKHGMLGKSSKTKRVPKSLFSASGDDVTQFIAGYFATDGTVHMRRGGTASITSASRGLLSDVQLLLQRLGIASVVGIKNGRYKGKRCQHWRLNVRGRDLWEFMHQIPVRGRKAWRLMQMAQPPEGRAKKAGMLHTIPSVWRKQLNHSSHWLREEFGIRVDNIYDTVPEKVLAVARVDGSKELEALAKASVVWDTVKSITPAGIAKTYDLEVPSLHNFIAEGIVVHNTSQCIARALYELGQDPNHLIKIISQSDTKAVKRLSVIRSHMKDNTRLHDVFPNLRLVEASEANKHQVTVQRTARMADPSIEALGITSSASGDRATILLADDVVDRRNAITLPKVRQQIKEAWDDWVNLLGGDGGVIWYIATLWHNLALTHDLMANEEWAVAWYEITKAMGCYVKLPDAREYSADHALWGWDASCTRHPSPGVEAEPVVGEKRPPRCRCGPWTKRALKRRRRELGARKFARGFSNKPMAEGELKVDPSWIRYYTVEPTDDWYWYLSLDTAESQEAQSAWTGFVIGAVDPETGHLRIWDAFHAKLKFPDRIKLVKSLALEIELERIIVERAGGGISMLEELVETTNLPLYGMPTKTKGGHSKDERFESITPRIERGQITFAPELDPTAGLVGLDRGDLISEVLEWGTYATKDIADAFVHLARYCSLKHPCAVDEEAEGVAGSIYGARIRQDDECMSVTLIG